ncbi:MAG: amidohydrolase family protein [Clostridiaceae bacterium]|jgi:imidazolonepropionase-like amidohydrolase|nr:amidohydrolase family protein [Clostridiaceae bacterium]
MDKTWIRNVRIADEISGWHTGDVLLVGTKIVEVSERPLEVDASTLEGNGRFLLPGFIHTHAHLMENTDGFNTENLHRWLRSGITHIRDQGILSRHSAEDAVTWRDNLPVAEGVPTLSICGPFLSAPGGYGGLCLIGVSSPAEVREAVRRLVDAGVDHLKLAYDEGYDASTRNLPMLEPEWIEAICDEAHRQGYTVSAHVTRAARLETLVACGIDEAAHACMDPMPDALIERMVRDGVVMTPTLSMYAMFAERTRLPLLGPALDNTLRFVRAGGVIGLGNDYMGEDPPWAPVGMPYLEMECLLRAGLEMPEVIRAATRGGALILGRQDLGRIEPGCRADLLLLTEDPTAGPEALSSVSHVIKDGTVFKV